MAYPKRQHHQKNPFDELFKQKAKPFAEPTSESSDESELAQRSFKLTFKDVPLPEVKTTSDEATSSSTSSESTSSSEEYEVKAKDKAQARK